MLEIINILLGLGLLVSGRKLFWLFVATIGFVAGVQLTLRVWSGPEWMAILIGLVVGALFASLAMFIKSLAIGIAGFLAGGSILLGLAGIFKLDTGALALVIYIVGGIIGILLLSMLFDWALIILSSLAGAALVTQVANLSAALGGLAFLVLAGIGIAIQSSELRREKKHG